MIIKKDSKTPLPSPSIYVLDTNVLIHDPNAVLNFEEHTVAISMVVLEELDKLKSGANAVAADCRHAIRKIDSIIGQAPIEMLTTGVPIERGKDTTEGHLKILNSSGKSGIASLSMSSNDNLIINQALYLKEISDTSVILVSKDINMRLKARSCGLEAQDYHTDQLVDDVDLLPQGFHHLESAIWDIANKVDSKNKTSTTEHHITLSKPVPGLSVNQFIIDGHGFLGWVKEVDGSDLVVEEINKQSLLKQEAWGLSPRDIYQGFAMKALLDPDIHLVNISGSAGSGKTILALAAAIEQTMVTKQYSKIIVTRSVQGLDEDIGFLPGTEEEKMMPWLGAFMDNLEALHADDECSQGSIDYIMNKVPLQFKSLNFIRGRSFQNSFIIIDECQNLTPHQMKTIITRAGNNSKVICLGNLAQIDTPYLSATSSGLTYITERFRGFKHGAQITLQGVPRSVLAEYAEANL